MCIGVYVQVCVCLGDLRARPVCLALSVIQVVTQPMVSREGCAEAVA
jgi:hypothetical protein